MLCYVASEKNTNYFIADSGASQHMCFRREYYDTFSAFSQPVKLTIGNSEVVETIGKGNIGVMVKIGRSEQ